MLNKRTRFIFAFLLAAWLTGCANLNSIHRKGSIPENGLTEFVDAKQRAIIAVRDPDRSYYGFDGQDLPRHYRVCAEAAPDVFSIYALAAAGRVNAQSNSAGNPSGGGEISSSFSENGAALERTQTINLIRESMYRTCERYLSGAIDSTTMQIQAARDQRAMVAILAIEQITGVVRQQPTILTSQAQSQIVTANAELVTQQLEESKTLTKKQAKLDEATAQKNNAKVAYEGLIDGQCAAISASPEPELSGGAETASETVTTIEQTTNTDGSDDKKSDTKESSPSSG